MPESSDRPVSVDFAKDDLSAVINSINEVCNGISIEDSEFQARIGSTRIELQLILERLTGIYDRKWP